MTDTDFNDLKPEITFVPIAELVPSLHRADAGLRVKRLKEPSSSAELVLVFMVTVVWFHETRIHLDCHTLIIKHMFNGFLSGS